MNARGVIGSESHLYQELADMAAHGRPGVLATVVQARLSTPREEGSKMIIHPDGRITGSVGGGRAEAEVIKAAHEVMSDGRCRNLDLDLAKGLGVCGGNMTVFLEPILRSVACVVIGAGHVGRAILDLASQLPLRFMVVDDREEFLGPLREIGGVDTLHADPEGLADHLTVNPHGAMIIASRGHELDGRYLQTVLKAEAAAGLEFGFLGVLGSWSKSQRIRKEIASQLPEAADRMERIQMPVGLDIGAETPHEIALSVLGEVLGVLRERPYVADAAGKPLGVQLQRCKGRKESS
jgi:xanthine dehydrogenase accessory factor